ncbi:MAG: branched-chain amino acid ABC transporter permease, partial [Desulfobacterales bacterium]|nr:branched-chain amino acid ABC transporter permease [Desulfobacterales bacterium]
MILFNEILQTILSGISVGCIYGLVALGFVMIFKATEVINFAQGELMMVGAFIAFTLISIFHLSYWTTLLLTTLFMALFGLIIERVVLRPLVGQPIFSMVMVTIGLMIFFKSVVSMIPAWGTDTYGFGTPFTEKLVKYNEIIISWEHLSIIILTVLLILALFIFFRFTKMGVAMRATSQNQLAAVYMGISVNRVFSLTWVISAILGGFAGILLSPITFVHMNMGLIGLKAMPA